MYIEIKKRAAGDWFFHIKATNGKILAHSETYSSLSKAKQTANKIASNLVAYVGVVKKDGATQIVPITKVRS